MWQKVWTATFIFSEGLSKLPLRALNQMDEWMKSSGFGEHSIWYAGFAASMFRVKIFLHMYVNYFRRTYPGTYWCRKGGWQSEKRETTWMNGWDANWGCAADRDRLFPRVSVEHAVSSSAVWRWTSQSLPLASTKVAKVTFEIWYLNLERYVSRSQFRTDLFQAAREKTGWSQRGRHQYPRPHYSRENSWLWTGVFALTLF